MAGVQVNMKPKASKQVKNIYSNLEDILACMPGSVYWKDKNGVYLGCNDSMADILGLPKTEIFGKTDYDFVKKLGWSKDLIESFRKDDLEVINTGVSKLSNEETPFTDCKGNIIHQLTNKVPLRDENGDVVGVIGISIDISDQKKIERNLQIAKEHAEKKAENAYSNLEMVIACLPGSVYWKDKNGVYLGCSDGLTKILGIPRVDILGKTDYDFAAKLGFDKKIADRFREDDMEVINSGVPKFNNEEEPFIDTAGNVINQLTNKVPLRDETGNVVGIVGISIDISDRKRHETELKEAKERAEAADLLKSNFIHNMEHDLRTPFSGIVGVADLLMAIETDPEKKEYAKMIKECSQRLLTYCNNVLDFSKIQTGTYPLLEKKFNIKELVQQVVMLEKPAAEIKKLNFIEDIASNIPDVLIGDPNRLERLLLDLVGNAIKFTKEGFVKITVRLGKIEKDKRAILCFYIEDTGIGISKELQPIIYEKFVRGTPSNKEQ